MIPNGTYPARFSTAITLSGNYRLSDELVEAIQKGQRNMARAFAMWDIDSQMRFAEAADDNQR